MKEGEPARCYWVRAGELALMEIDLGAMLPPLEPVRRPPTREEMLAAIRREKARRAARRGEIGGERGAE